MVSLRGGKMKAIYKITLMSVLLNPGLMLAMENDENPENWPKLIPFNEIVHPGDEEITERKQILEKRLNHISKSISKNPEKIIPILTEYPPVNLYDLGTFLLNEKMIHEKECETLQLSNYTNKKNKKIWEYHTSNLCSKLVEIFTQMAKEERLPKKKSLIFSFSPGQKNLPKICADEGRVAYELGCPIFYKMYEKINQKIKKQIKKEEEKIERIKFISSSQNLFNLACQAKF